MATTQFLRLFDTQELPVDSEPIFYPIDPSNKFSTPADPFIYPIDASGKAVVPAHEQNVAFVWDLYSTYYHRAPDASGLNWWASQLDNGAARSNVTNAFATTPDISPNPGQSLYDYLISQGITPPPGTPGAPGEVATVTYPIDPSNKTTSTSTALAGSTITALPIVGPVVQSISTTTGWSPTVITIAGVLLGLWALSSLGGGSSKSS